MNSTNHEKIAIQDIDKIFYKKCGRRYEMVEALKGVSFTVRKDEFMTVVGPSGCGKTTLLRIIDGLIKPDQGRVLIDGQPISGPRTGSGAWCSRVLGSCPGKRCWIT